MKSKRAATLQEMNVEPPLFHRSEQALVRYYISLCMRDSDKVHKLGTSGFQPIHRDRND